MKHRWQTKLMGRFGPSICLGRIYITPLRWTGNASDDVFTLHFGWKGAWRIGFELSVGGWRLYLFGWAAAGFWRDLLFWRRSDL